MEPNREANNPWEMQRANANRPGNLMYDIKKPAPQTPPGSVRTDNYTPPSIEKYDAKGKSHKKLYVLLTLIVLLLVISGYTAFYFYQKANKISEETSNQPADQLNLAVNEIGKLVILPINDNPTLSVVVDAEEARQNQLFGLFKFFENAEAGDMWLTYQKTGKNILYRPTIKKIVNMMTFPPDTLTASTTTATSTSATTTRPR